MGKINVMVEVKQLTTEELQQIKEMQAQYNKYVFELGSVEAQLQQLLQQKSALETEKGNIVSDISKLAQRESELVKTLQDKYGTGSINPETGEITPL
jgi:conjugal transfer/entry exclusion protein